MSKHTYKVFKNRENNYEVHLIRDQYFIGTWWVSTEAEAHHYGRMWERAVPQEKEETNG